MKQLKLPPCNLSIKTEEGNQFVFDILRKKYLVLTSEEWVRQHFVHLLINHLEYPKSLIKVETGLTYIKQNKRSDITVLDKNGKVFLLVECKSPDVKINQSVLNQIAVYNKVLQAQYITVTNGLSHFVWKLENENYKQLSTFPAYNS